MSWGPWAKSTHCDKKFVQGYRGRLEQVRFKGHLVGHRVNLVRKLEDRCRKILAPNGGLFSFPGSGRKILEVYDPGHNTVRLALDN